METAKYKWDNPVVLLIVTGAVLFLLYRLSITGRFQKTEKLPLTALLYGTGISLVIVLLVRGTAICDGETVSEIAISFMQGNYDAFRQGEYLYNYSFQIGLTAFLEVLYHLAGVQNYLAFQIINVAAVAVILFSLDQITKELFTEEIRKLEAILSMGMLPLFLFSTFVYGDLIGWAFGMLAIWQMICYLKSSIAGMRHCDQVQYQYCSCSHSDRCFTELFPEKKVQRSAVYTSHSFAADGM